MRQTDHLAALNRRFPGLWRAVDLWRHRFAHEWPAWCYIPIYEAECLLASNDPNLAAEEAEHSPAIAALAAWRQTQGIYRLDPDLAEALWQTPVDGQIPVGVLDRLPEWCVYVETPGRTIMGEQLHGFYAHLDRETGRNPTVPVPRNELRFMFDTDAGLLADGVDLSRGTLAEGLDALTAEVEANAKAFGLGRVDNLRALMPSARDVAPILSTLLYLCSEAAEVRDRKGGDRQPTGHKPPKRTPNAPTIWETGYRLGAALRHAREARSSEALGGSHASPRPHVRRAHWHSFWIGPRDGERRVVLKWLPPIAVNVESPDGLVPTVRRVDLGEGA